MKLLHSYIIIKPITEEKTKSGLYLALETQNTSQLTGTIEYVGKDVTDEDIKPGVKVVFDKLNSSDSPAPFEGKILEYDDIIAILD